MGKIIGADKDFMDDIIKIIDINRDECISIIEWLEFNKLLKKKMLSWGNRGKNKCKNINDIMERMLEKISYMEDIIIHKDNNGDSDNKIMIKCNNKQKVDTITKDFNSCELKQSDKDNKKILIKAND